MRARIGKNRVAHLLVPSTAEKVHHNGEGAVMKKILAVCVLAVAAFSISPAQEVAANFGVFYSSLSPHGDWIAMDGGTYAWHPGGVPAGWRPYTEGEWVWTDDGWYWQTDEPWGWATYHYGRWYYDDFYGWVWIPGYEWAPAWVEWRWGGGFFGWAPLGPYAVFNSGWGIHYRRYWATPAFYWSFADCRYMTVHGIHRYLYRTDENARFIGRTRTGGSVRYDNGRVITRGPERDYIERSGNIRIQRADMVDVRERGQAGIVRDGSRERVSVFRPRIDAGARDAAVARPERLRTDDHRLNLDTRGTDLRRAEAGNGGRNLRKAEEYRARPDAVQRTPGAARTRPGYEGRVPRSERKIERDPALPQRYAVPHGRGIERATPSPRVGRESAPPPRMSAPDRGTGRSSPPTSRGGGSRSGGGERGGGGKGRR
jgi:hypothetical protein